MIPIYIRHCTQFSYVIHIFLQLWNINASTFSIFLYTLNYILFPSNYVKLAHNYTHLYPKSMILFNFNFDYLKQQQIQRGRCTWESTHKNWINSNQKLVLDTIALAQINSFIDERYILRLFFSLQIWTEILFTLKSFEFIFPMKSQNFKFFCGRKYEIISIKIDRFYSYYWVHFSWQKKNVYG